MEMFVIAAIAAAVTLSALHFSKGRRLALARVAHLQSELVAMEKGQIDLIAENATMSERLERLHAVEQEVIELRRENGRRNVTIDRLSQREAGLALENAKLTERLSTSGSLAIQTKHLQTEIEALQRTNATLQKELTKLRGFEKVMQPEAGPKVEPQPWVGNSMTGVGLAG